MTSSWRGGTVSHEAEILRPALREKGEGVGGRGRLGMRLASPPCR